MLTFPPILHKTCRIPVLVGLSETFSNVVSDPGIKAAAAMKNAAEEISLGTTTFLPFSRGFPETEIVTPSSAVFTSAPNALSMISV